MTLSRALKRRITHERTIGRIRNHRYGRIHMVIVGGSGMNEELKPCPNCGADMREDGEADADVES